jgi:ABC-type multidrug transport system ATPase subunit
MARRPPLLVLDEPYAHLDHERARALTSVLEGHVDRGGGVLYTCHALADLALADRVVVLEDRRIVGTWSPSDPRVVQALR